MSQSRAPRSALVPPRARTWRRRSAGVLGGALVLASALSACSSGNGSPEKSSIKVGYVEGIGAATLHLAISEGVFGQTGLTVTPQPYPSDTAEEAALKSGAIDIALGDYTEFLDTAAKGSVAGSIQVIAEGYDAGDNTIGLVAAAGSSFLHQSLTGDGSVSADIAAGNTSVDVPTNNSPEYVALANWAIAEQAPLGLNLPSIHQAQAATGAEATAQAMVSAVGSGSTQLAVMQEPFLTEALETGKVVEIADLDTGNANNMPLQGYFALTTTTTSDPRTVAAFQEAMTNAQALGQSRVNVEKALTGNGVSQKVAATTEIGNFPSGIVAANIDNILSLMGSAQVATSSLTSAGLTGGASNF